ncbi:hypothetical protein MMI99_04125 [Enterococcus cecorum]|uniref:hypothetical protein n=1 Tax=Enterococcus cecorum TaxID=44008 RepID=UPI001FAC9C2B|nr:hypothetical protein [Enterococcus cecorum]MCJ0592301.1 hypothetical protein [Enterococcus cecorum]
MLNGIFVTLLVTSLGLAGCQQEKKSESKTSTSTKVIKKKSTKDKKKKTKTSSSKTESTTKQASTTKEQTTQSKTTTSQAPQAEKTKSSTPVKPAAQPTILDTLVGKNFVFSSGSGGWGARFLSDLMAFSGNYHNSDMGSTGPGYPGGTISESKLSGQFTRAHQVSPTLYEVYLENLQYEKPVGSLEIKDNVKYEYTEVYGISKNTRMAIYLPGTPISSMPEELRLYSYGLIPEDSQTLPVYVIQEDMEGFFIEYH